MQLLEPQQVHVDLNSATHLLLIANKNWDLKDVSYTGVACE